MLEKCQCGKNEKLKVHSFFNGDYYFKLGIEAIIAEILNKKSTPINSLSVYFINNVNFVYAFRVISSIQRTDSCIFICKDDDYEILSKKTDFSNFLFIAESSSVDAVKTKVYRWLFNTKYYNKRLSDPGIETKLTRKEFEVVQRFFFGKSLQEIAVLDNSSIKTVSTHKRSAMRKLHVSSNQKLYAKLLVKSLRCVINAAE